MRRTMLWLATLATVLPLTYLLTRTLVGRIGLIDAAMIALFFVLTTWIALWFWIAATGAWLAWGRMSPRRIVLPPIPLDQLPPLSKTAILLPVYNEEPAEVFARIRAMLKSLEAAGFADAFDFFVLSDTRDPDIWLEEQWNWLQLQSELARKGAVYYRRRTENVGRKAGNIADFCERWGASYRFMVVLDADSLMEGSVLVELVRRMDADPQLGLLQTPTLPLGDRSLLSRCQQFAAKLCTPLLAEGLEWFSGDGGNYWGHNAIIRTAAFTRFCGLGDLPGKAPLGGQILSHDFVEAALMQRAGYKVRLAADLTASYEQCPTTLPLFAQRDQRWCQGNMQHARLVVSRRIPLSNRFHFATGVMAFLSSPLWLAFLFVGIFARFVNAYGYKVNTGDDPTGITSWLAFLVFGAVMLMLVAPRIWGALLALRDPRLRAGYGGALRLAESVLLEFAISVLMAPIMMAFHTLFIVTTLAGHRVEWGSQSRSDTDVPLGQAWYVHRGQTIAGIVATVVIAFLLPSALPWLSPILAGLVLSVPISMAMSSAEVGDWFKTRRLLCIPEEHERPEVVQRFDRELAVLNARGWPDRSRLFQRLLDDPTWLRSHLTMLEATAGSATANTTAVEAVSERIRAGEWSKVTAKEKVAALRDPAALTDLHHLVWSLHGDRLVAENRLNMELRPRTSGVGVDEAVTTVTGGVPADVRGFSDTP
jgi:membrane glycosyltransferase